MRHFVRFVLLAATLMVALATAVSAVASPAPWERVDITRYANQGDGVMLVAGVLPESTPLPAEAVLAVPSGLQLQWIGQILGGPAEEDPELAHTVTMADGMDLYRVVLTKSRIAQVEVVVHEGQTFDGMAYTSSVSWTAPHNVSEVNLNIRIPQAAQIAKPVEGAAILPGDEGYAYFAKTYPNVQAGDRLELPVVYTLPATAGAGTSAGQSSGSSDAVPILLGILGLAGAVGVTVAVRRKLASRVSGDDETIEDDEEVAIWSTGVDGGAGVVDAIDDEEQAEVGMTGSAKRSLVTGAIVLVLLVAAVTVGARSTRPQATGDTISQTFSAGEPCETTSVAVKDAGDPQATAKRLFDALETMNGLKAATYNVKAGTVDVGYCESETSAGAVRQVLERTGLVAPGGSVVQTVTP